MFVYPMKLSLAEAHDCFKIIDGAVNGLSKVIQVLLKVEWIPV